MLVEKADSSKTHVTTGELYKSLITSNETKYNVADLSQGKNTPCAPRGGKPPALGKDPSSGLFAGDGARAPFGCAHVWSTKSVFISGLGLGFLHS